MSGTSPVGAGGVACYASPMRRSAQVFAAFAATAFAVLCGFTSTATAQIEIGPQRGLLVPSPARPAQEQLPSDAELQRVKVSDELVRLAKDMGAQEFAARVAAREAMLARKPTRDELMALLLRTDISEESRNAVVGMLTNIILTAPRGALGIRMDLGVIRERGVRVTGVVPGMPAEKVLLAGDLIESVAGQPVNDRNDLVSVVQGLPPGAETKLTVRRTKRDAQGKALIGADGLEVTELLDVALRLGSTEELNERGDPMQPAFINPATQARQWTAAAAAQRFLSPPVEVPVKRRFSARAVDGPITMASVRQLLVEAQLSGADADTVRRFRKRLDSLEQQLDQIRRIGGAPADRANFEQVIQNGLEALDTEIRAVF